jgi:flagellar biosynthesis protein FlhG
MKKHISGKFVRGEKCIYPIAGGKGGTGKSFLAASLGTILAKQGKKILLVDLDLGASNLHTFLGLRKPRVSLKQYLNKEINDLNDVVLKTTQPNLSIISSSGCSLEIANLYYAQKLKIIRAINNLSYDYIFIDLGSGTHFNTLDFFLMSNKGILVTTPEPVSIENMFRFMKSLYLRKIKAVLKDYNLNVICREYLNNIQDSQIISFSSLLDCELTTPRFSIQRNNPRSPKSLLNFPPNRIGPWLIPWHISCIFDPQLQTFLSVALPPTLEE